MTSEASADGVNTELQSPFGVCQLRRYPIRRRELLQAWDAADELLLAEMAQLVSQQDLDNGDKAIKVLVVNDGFGGLSVPLQMAQMKVFHWTDSYVAQQAVKQNLAHNDLPSLAAYWPSTRVLSSSSAALMPHNEDEYGDEDGIEAESSHDVVFTAVLIKIPKTLALLEHQLQQLRAVIGDQITSKTTFVVGGMIKHMPATVFKLLEKYIGPTRTSLAKKKARLIFAELQAPVGVLADVMAGELQTNQTPTGYTDPLVGFELVAYANVFAKERLDIGARFLLEQFSNLSSANTGANIIVDLGCGNGVLGIKAQQQMPGSQLFGVDESYMAIASARHNHRQALPDEQATYLVSNSLENLPADVKADLVLCNPPFHQQHTVSEHIARQMFADSRRALAFGGELWVVANRHLGYAKHLKRLFGNCRVQAQNQKFIVLVATVNR